MLPLQGLSESLHGEESEGYSCSRGGCHPGPQCTQSRGAQAGERSSEVTPGRGLSWLTVQLQDRGPSLNPSEPALSPYNKEEHPSYAEL